MATNVTALVSAAHLTESGAVNLLVVELGYGPKHAEIDVYLSPAIDGGMPAAEVVAEELRELGNALIRISARPKDIVLSLRHEK